ncbi:MAG: hypothetical protein GXP01_04835, partial [Alphaproteobacteria bacterium]|nr:hypothetical protein [Alphaproteobacteria bacterium]
MSDRTGWRAVRIILAALVFLGICILTRAPLPRGRQWLAGLVLGLGFLVLAWASSFSVIKIALTDVGPYWLA